MIEGLSSGRMRPPLLWSLQQKVNGGGSSVGRAPDCDSGCRGFEPHQSPQINNDLELKPLGHFSFVGHWRDISKKYHRFSSE